jgi:AmmeMemoRadiSam system protein A
MQTQHRDSQNLSPEQGQLLVKLARQTLMERLGKEVPQNQIDALNTASKDPCFQISRGTFVTLKIKGQLRGCIGNLASNESLVAGIRRNAINAAFHDPRFAPLSASELDRVEIEISILTESQPLNYRDGADLLSKLRPKVDGVTIRLGHAGATFLPQVWEQLPQPQDFLAHLCLKAGLVADAWKNGKLEVSTYQALYFEEQPAHA